MLEDEFSFKFPELNFDFKDIDTDHKIDVNILNKIYEYLDNDIKEQDAFIRMLLEFEKKL